MSNNPKKLSLKERINFLAKDSFIYGGGNAINKLISLLVFPLLTRYFSTGQYGILDSFYLIANLFTILLVFGQDSAVARYYYEYENIKQKKQVVSQSLLIQVFFMILLIPILWNMAPDISMIYTKKIDYVNIIKIIIILIPIGVAHNFSVNLLKWTFQRWKFLLLTVGESTTYLILTAIAVIFFKPEIVSLFYIFLVVRFIYASVGLWLTKKFIIFSNNFEISKKLLNYAYPYGIICVIGAFLPALDRYFITNFLTPISLGLYAAGYKIASMISLPINAFQTAWGPFYLSIHKEKNSSKTYNIILIGYTIIIAFSVLVLTALSKYILIFFASTKYTGAEIIVFPLAFGIALMSITDIIGIGIELSKKTLPKIYGLLLRLLVFSIIAYTTISHFGIIAVAFAVLISYLINGLINIIYGYRQYSLRYELKLPIYIVILTFLAGAFMFIIDYMSLEYSIILKFINLLLFSIILYFILPQHYTIQLVKTITAIMKNNKLVNKIKKENIENKVCPKDNSNI